MKKQELLHLHGLLANVRHEVENIWDLEIDFEDYESLGVQPNSIHKGKYEHKEALFELASDLTDGLDETGIESVPDVKDWERRLLLGKPRYSQDCGYDAVERLALQEGEKLEPGVEREGDYLAVDLEKVAQEFEKNPDVRYDGSSVKSDLSFTLTRDYIFIDTEENKAVIRYSPKEYSTEDIIDRIDEDIDEETVNRDILHDSNLPGVQATVDIGEEASREYDLTYGAAEAIQESGQGELIETSHSGNILRIYNQEETPEEPELEGETETYVNEATT